MISDAVIDALVASGCSPEQLAAAMKASRKASSGAARQAAYRERKNAKKETVVDDIEVTPVTSRNVTDTSPVVTERNGQDGFSLSPVPLLSPTPPNNPLTPKPSSKKQQTRAHRLPENAEISGPDLAYGLSKGLTDRETIDLWQRMASWAWSAGGSNASKVNWHQAFQGWVQRDGPGIIAARRNASGKPLTEHQRKQHEAQDILHDIDNLIGRSSQSRTEDIGLLPDYSGERSQDVRSGADQGFDWIPAGSG